MKKREITSHLSKYDVRDVEAAVPVSLKTGAGVEQLRPALARALAGDVPWSDPPPVTNVRHVTLLEHCRDALKRAASAAVAGTSEEFVLADLHEARGALEEITGRRTPDDVLAHIFSRFCIGK
jgi:tRNA modification GTPase